MSHDYKKVACWILRPVGKVYFNRHKKAQYGMPYETFDGDRRRYCCPTDVRIRNLLARRYRMVSALVSSWYCVYLISPCILSDFFAAWTIKLFWQILLVWAVFKMNITSQVTLRFPPSKYKDGFPRRLCLLSSNVQISLFRIRILVAMDACARLCACLATVGATLNMMIMKLKHSSKMFTDNFVCWVQTNSLDTTSPLPCGAESGCVYY